MKRPINFCNYSNAKFDLINGSPKENKLSGVKLYDYSLSIEWEWSKIESKDSKYRLYLHGKRSTKNKLDFLKLNC